MPQPGSSNSRASPPASPMASSYISLTVSSWPTLRSAAQPTPPPAARLAYGQPQDSPMVSRSARSVSPVNSPTGSPPVDRPRDPDGRGFNCHRIPRGKPPDGRQLGSSACGSFRPTCQFSTKAPYRGTSSPGVQPRQTLGKMVMKLRPNRTAGVLPWSRPSSATSAALASCVPAHRRPLASIGQLVAAIMIAPASAYVVGRRAWYDKFAD